MCNKACLSFGERHLSRAEVEGQRVIEVGSRDVNGSLRGLIERLRPAKYLGVDTTAGPGVDVVCRGEDIVQRFGEASFDIVICTEVAEHVRDWRRLVSNLKRICGEGGIILLTTRSYPFHYHGRDFWRYETSDMERIFADFTRVEIEADWWSPGVFVKAVKGRDFQEVSLVDAELYSVILDRRAKDVSDEEIAAFMRSVRGFLVRHVQPLAFQVRRMLGQFERPRPA